MAGPFTRGADGAVELWIDDDERDVLRDLFGQVAELVEDPAAPAADADPLTEMLGIGTRTSAPVDPALARLFPDAYNDDEGAAGDFRRYTEPTLRRRKAGHAATVLATLDRPERPVPLAAPEVAAWLGALNDVRLVLGVRLGVGEDDDEGEDPFDVDEEDRSPEAWTRVLYHWLTYLQGDLLDVLDADAG
jgi:hypothetical protein